MGSMDTRTTSRLVDYPCFGPLHSGLRTDRGDEPGTHITEDLGVHRVRFLHHDRSPGIATMTDFGVERQCTEKRHVIGLGRFLSPTMIENVGSGLTVRTEKVAHVFDQTQNWHLHGA